MKYLLVFGKSLFFYLLITVVYRIMGKREIGELSIMDFIVSIFIAELAAISIENYNDNMFLFRVNDEIEKEHNIFKDILMNKIIYKYG